MDLRRGTYLPAQANEDQQPLFRKRIDIVPETGRRHLAQKEDLDMPENRATLAQK
jgi:hypothetical protein